MKSAGRARARPRRALVVVALASMLAASPALAADRDAWFAHDKALHFGVSAGIAAGTYSAAVLLDASRAHALLVAGSATLAVGAAKEALDMAGLGHPSWKDFTWDVVGTVAGLGLAWGLDLLVRGTGQDAPRLAPSEANAGGLVLSF